MAIRDGPQQLPDSGGRAIASTRIVKIAYTTEAKGRIPLDASMSEWASIRTIVDSQPIGKLLHIGMVFYISMTETFIRSDHCCDS